MKREQSGAFLSAVFVDYDNIYLSLKRKSDEAARRFAKDAALWLKQIETGGLITPTNGEGIDARRRLVMNRCYGNPVPRRSSADNSTDMSSFPFVRHHFLRAGFEIIDCPPLTAQLKNSSDIRMVMDVRDLLSHATYFDEFVILSGDADFTPLLHRLRAHARRTVIFATEYTAAPYTAISDGEIREADLITLLLEGRLDAGANPADAAGDAAAKENARRDILADIAIAVRAAAQPVPLEVLADRAVRLFGHERTIGTSWGGAGGFREMLAQGLPDGLKLSGEPPYVVIDTQRHLPAPAALQAAALIPAAPSTAAPASMPSYDAIEAPRAPARTPAAAQQTYTNREQPLARSAQAAPATPAAPAAAGGTAVAGYGIGRSAGFGAAVAAGAPTYASGSVAQAGDAVPPRRMPDYQSTPPASPPPPAPVPAGRGADSQTHIQQSIARIHEACQAPPLAPPEYRQLFEVMAQEINENGLIGAQTIQNISARAAERGIDIRRDDVRFVIEVVSETDPWFEQGASANLFAGRFRNFVVARCRSQGLNLSADELDLIEAWFAGGGTGAATGSARASGGSGASLPSAPQRAAAPSTAEAPRPGQAQGWSLDDGRQVPAADRAPGRQAIVDAPTDDFPRIVRTRLRG